jgi:hypothetical protein
VHFTPEINAGWVALLFWEQEVAGLSPVAHFTPDINAGCELQCTSLQGSTHVVNCHSRDGHVAPSLENGGRSPPGSPMHAHQIQAGVVGEGQLVWEWCKCDARCRSSTRQMWRTGVVFRKEGHRVQRWCKSNAGRRSGVRVS